MSSRTALALRAAVLSASVPLVGLLASPALANSRDDGDDPGPGLTAWQTVGLYVLIPLAVVVVVSLLIYTTASTKGPRYRPGVGWWAAPVWFNGGPVADPDHSDVPGSHVNVAGGGTSARW